MARINFFIQSTSKPAGIYVRLRDGRKTDTKAKTNFAINPEDWSKVKGKPRNLKDEKFKALNTELVNFSTNLLNHFNKNLGKTPITSDWLKLFINPPQKTNELPNNLVAYFDHYAEHQKNSITDSTYKKVYVNKHLLERFQKETKREYLIAEVDANFKLKFEEYCLKEKYAPNTIARAIKFIKTICYHARTNGIETSRLLEGISVKFQSTDKVYLPYDELALIEKKKFESEHLDNARDWLLISCETGQRVSDFMRFSKNMIRYEKKKPLIEFTQIKTNKVMTVPLSK